MKNPVAKGVGVIVDVSVAVGGRGVKVEVNAGVAVSVDPAGTFCVGIPKRARNGMEFRMRSGIPPGMKNITPTSDKASSRKK